MTSTIQRRSTPAEIAAKHISIFESGMPEEPQFKATAFAYPIGDFDNLRDAMIVGADLRRRIVELIEAERAK